MKALFVCNQGRNRSKTAEILFKEAFQTRSAGLYGDNLLSEEDMKWADVVFVMEEWQANEIARRFPSQYLSKRVVCLNIDDVYSFGDENLKKELIKRVREFY
ncbi:phosphotyrosine protein phosphatase [Candidatus Woesearchaeota archaeon]|nr:MAG: phosphotyrosine protein phosphatase [Candidatus Woesearchaeota archaeon]